MALVVVEAQPRKRNDIVLEFVKFVLVQKMFHDGCQCQTQPRTRSNSQGSLVIKIKVPCGSRELWVGRDGLGRYLNGCTKWATPRSNGLSLQSSSLYLESEAMDDEECVESVEMRSELIRYLVR